jgi:hypothetical protein
MTPQQIASWVRWGKMATPTPTRPAMSRGGPHKRKYFTPEQKAEANRERAREYYRRKRMSANVTDAELDRRASLMLARERKNMEQFEAKESSNVGWARYDPRTLILEVDFRGKDGLRASTYAYDGVPESLWTEFLRAESKGKFFASEIRPRFKGRKIA